MYLAFRAAISRFAAPIDRVREVLPSVALTVLPSAPATVAGILELRGEALAVIDLGCLLTGHRKPMNIGQRIIILTQKQRAFGVLVDEVDDLIEIQDQVLRNIEGSGPPWLKQVILGNDELILLLDIESLLGCSPEHIVPV